MGAAVKQGPSGPSVERVLREAAGALLVDPRILRRVIKEHRQASGLVPHVSCYTLPREAAFELLGPEELAGVQLASELPTEVILIARPAPRELAGRSRRHTMTRLWRLVLHARIHQVLERKVAAGELGEPEIRRRIDAIGHAEFDEIRAILRHDDLLLPPGDDRECYLEFAALFLELKYFAPELLVTTFPGIVDYERVMATLGADVDAAKLVAQGRPSEVAALASTRHLRATSAPSYSAPLTLAGLGVTKVRPVSEAGHNRLMSRAQRFRDKGNDVRAALLAVRAASVDNEPMQKAADRQAREAVTSLGRRLDVALRDGEGKGGRIEWSALLYLLADRAVGARRIRYGIEARLLFQLQLAAIAAETPRRVVDLPGWMLSLGKRAIVRDLVATRELAITRHLLLASEQVRHTRMGDADRKLLARLIGLALARADANCRAVLRPRIVAVFESVGLAASSGIEELAREKVADELLDRALRRGFLSFDALRDAVSRNLAKLDDLKGPGELWRGDPLLKADAALAQTLDGIYRRGDIYLRGLQKVSSIPFGTRWGRNLTLFAILPLGAAFVVLEGLGYLSGHLLTALDRPVVPLLTPSSFALTALVIFALLHSTPFRQFARQVLDIVGGVLAFLLFRLPRFLLARPGVKRLLGLPQVRMVLRRGIVPALVAAGAYYGAPLGSFAWWVPPAVAAVCFALVSLVMGSRIGAWLEDFAVDHLAPTWQAVRRQWLPGVFRLIGRFFVALMDLLQRGIYRVDELLRFQQGRGPVLMALLGAAGLCWAVVAYVVRLYATLLIEPEINPLKHFPTVTVAHKLMLPYTLEIQAAFEAPLGAVLGPIAAGTIAWVTVALLPSVFGFLAWELKENYKLYRATRPKLLPSAPVGPHGETMRGLLLVGMHSGTLPKLYERLRRAAQRADEGRLVGRGDPRTGSRLGGLGTFRAGLREIEEGVHRFVARELLAVLHRCPRWTAGKLTIVGVDLSSNRVRVRLQCRSLSPACCELTIEEQSGFVMAGVSQAGFLDALRERSSDCLLLFENALAGFYQRAEVGLVREQVAAELGEGAHYDVTDEGLIVWPESDYRSELVYRLDGARGAVIEPQLRGPKPELPLRVLELRRVAYREQAISWNAWLACWRIAEHERAKLSRLLSGPSILPLSPTRAPTSAPRPAPGMGPPAPNCGDKAILAERALDPPGAP